MEIFKCVKSPMKKITSQPNHLTKRIEKQFVTRLLQESGFPKGKKVYVKDQHGKLIVRFTKDFRYE